MKKLLWYGPRITAVLVSIIWLAQIAGKTRLSTLSNWFTNPDGTPCAHPCLFGVQPGVTTYNEAVELLRMHPMTRLFAAGIDKGVFNGDGATIYMFLGYGDVIVGIDRLQSTDLQCNSDAALGDVISAFGIPDLVGIGADLTRTYYLDRHIMFLNRRVDTRDLRPEEPLAGVMVFAQQPVASPDSVAWHGFGNVERYSNKAPTLRDINAIAHCDR